MPDTGSLVAINPIVEAISDGDAPLPLKLSAARGVLPLSRLDHVHVLVILLDDPSEAVRVEAAGCLNGIGQADILKLLADTSTVTMILDYYGTSDQADEKHRAVVLCNPSTSSETLIKMAPSMTKEQIDDLITRQTRLIEAPALLDLLAANPECTEAHKMRFDEVRRHFLKQPAPSPPVETVVEVPPEPEPEPEPEEMAPIQETTGTLETPEDEEGGRQAPNLMVARLGAAEKVKLAYTASKEERSILIKDSSKFIQAAVLDSPKLTEGEVEMFAKMRSVNEEVLRIIANKRDWIKNYVVAHSLATNPKTPIAISMNLIPRLTPKDLKLAVIDRNIPDAVRRHAKKIADKRNRRG